MTVVCVVVCRSAIQDLERRQSVMARRMEEQDSGYAFSSEEEKFSQGTCVGCGFPSSIPRPVRWENHPAGAIAHTLSPRNARYINCDLRYFNLEALGQFDIIHMDPPW